jgi:hypothetical protein
MFTRVFAILVILVAFASTAFGLLIRVQGLLTSVEGSSFLLIIGAVGFAGGAALLTVDTRIARLERLEALRAQHD